MTVRVALADDHTIVRAGVRALLERVPHVEVVGEAANGHEALALVDQYHPDVLLADIAMGEISGLQVAVRVRRDFPAVKVIILSMYANEQYVVQALHAGASGYLVKDAATAELELALHAAMAGQTYLSSSVSRLVIDAYLTRPHDGAREALTPRQCEILTLLAQGRSGKEIAFTLGISIKTVESHRAQLMERLGIHDIPGLVKYAMRTGLIPPEG